MLERLKRIISRLRSSGADLPPTSPPENPDIGVWQPKWGRRPGGSAAVAVAEPDEPGAPVAAIGRNRTA